MAWREPVNGIAEIVDVPADVLTEFSQRTAEVDLRIEEKLERFTETFERAPTPRERWRLEREAVLDSRPPKSEADPVSLEKEWVTRLADLGLSRQHLVANTIDVEFGIDGLDQSAARQVIDRALAELAGKQSTWRAAELVRELAAAVPTDLAMTADQLTTWLDDTAGKVVAARMIELSRPIPDGVELRRDGRPITEGAVDRLLTLPGILAEEERLLALAERRLALGGDDRAFEAEDLTGAQQDLAGAVAGDRALVLAVGPAGTGKTTALGPSVDQLRLEGRVVFGVAPSAAAAEVLAIDTGVDADTLDKLLIEHRLDRPPDHRYDLPVGATVILDEAAMVATPRLAELMELADRRGWRLVMVGDPLQFAAVGRSGMFGHFVDTFGGIELAQVHRFNHDWERDASLRLRRGDVSVIEVYDEHGRLHGGTAGRMRREVVNGWWSAIQAGETASMMAPTTDAVVALNLEAQRRHLVAGHLDGAGPRIQVGPYAIYPGDLVATRHNERRLVTDRHLMIKNRDRWTVQSVHRDASLSVAGRTGNVVLPADYVGEHVELAYAETSHANQGRTVDRSFLYLDGSTGANGIYVPMTRGRESNDAFVAIRGEGTAADVVAEALSRHWIDRPAVAVRAEVREVQPAEPHSVRRGADAPLSGGELRRLLERDAELEHELRMARAGRELAGRQATIVVGNHEALDRSIAQHEAQLEAAQRTLADFDRPLLRRRHRAEVEGARAAVKWLPGAIAGERASAADFESQERAARERLARAETTEDTRPQLIAERALVRYELDEDARLRGERLAAEPLSSAVRRLGPMPADQAGRELWIGAAGRLGHHQAAFDLPEGAGLGREPRWTRDDAYALSHRAASQSIERLDAAIGLHPEIELPHRGLEISLGMEL